MTSKDPFREYARDLKMEASYIEYSAINALQIRHKAYRVVECVISKLKMHCSAKINMKTILVMRFCNAIFSFVHYFPYNVEMGCID